MTPVESLLFQNELSRLKEKNELREPVKLQFQKFANGNLRMWRHNEIENCKYVGSKELNLLLTNNWDFLKKIESKKTLTKSEADKLDKIHEEFLEALKNCLDELREYNTNQKDRYELICLFFIGLFERNNRELIS